MPTEQEKGIYLDFPPGWGTAKYDGDSQANSASFYRTAITNRVQHMRGVDIVAQPPLPDNRLLLIEVKDYRQSSRPAERSTAELRETVLRKTLNTLSGLYAAARVGNEELRLVTARLFEAQLVIEVVLLLEQPAPAAAPGTTAAKLRRQNPQTAIHDLRLELTSMLSELGCAFHLRSSTTMQARDGWSVRLT